MFTRTCAADMFTRIHSASLHQVWLVSPSGEAFVRKGASASTPIGSKWLAIKGPPLRRVSVGEDQVWAVTTSGDVIFRRDVSAYKPQGSRWVTVARPSTSSCILVTASPRPEIVRVVTESGVSLPLSLFPFHSLLLCEAPFVHRAH